MNSIAELNGTLMLSALLKKSKKEMLPEF